MVETVGPTRLLHDARNWAWLVKEERLDPSPVLLLFRQSWEFKPQRSSIISFTCTRRWCGGSATRGAADEYGDVWLVDPRPSLARTKRAIDIAVSVTHPHVDDGRQPRGLCERVEQSGTPSRHRWWERYLDLGPGRVVFELDGAGVSQVVHGGECETCMDVHNLGFFTTRRAFLKCCGHGVVGAMRACMQPHVGTLAKHIERWPSMHAA